MCAFGRRNGLGTGVYPFCGRSLDPYFLVPSQKGEVRGAMPSVLSSASRRCLVYVDTKRTDAFATHVCSFLTIGLLI